MSAIFNEDQTRRYWLERIWTPTLGGPCPTTLDKHVCFVGLNPSKAGAETDDPTIRKECGFARRWGFSGIVAANLIPLVSTDPRNLQYWNGHYLDNDPHLKRALACCGAVVIAWGSVPAALRRSIRLAEHILHFKELAAGRKLFCIGLTKGGDPLHPSRAPYTNEMIEWSWE